MIYLLLYRLWSVGLLFYEYVTVFHFHVSSIYFLRSIFWIFWYPDSFHRLFSYNLICTQAFDMSIPRLRKSITCSITILSTWSLNLTRNFVITNIFVSFVEIAMSYFFTDFWSSLRRLSLVSAISIASFAQLFYRLTHFVPINFSICLLIIKLHSESLFLFPTVQLMIYPW